MDAECVASVLNALTEGLVSRWLSQEITAAEARAHLRATAEAMLPRSGRGPRKAVRA